MSNAELKMITVALDDLLLDPSNPRFVEDLRVSGEIPDDEVEGLQEAILKKFRTKADPAVIDEDESSFIVHDLIDSMRQIGFVSIDRVVVRKLETRRKTKTPKYLVIEGNRRVSAAKKLRQEDRDKKNPADKLAAVLRASLEELEVLLLETEGLSKSEIHDKVGVILGLRHYGSVLEWEPMPKAKNIYGEYMQGSPALKEFALHAERVSGVGKRLSVKRADVIKALKTYVAYLQLNRAFPVGPRPEHYSLLEALVTNTKLRGSRYILQDDITCALSNSSLEKLNTICQFEQRNRLGPDEKVLAEPKSVSAFASLVSDAYTHQHPGIQGYARSLLEEVEGVQRPLDDAIDALISFKAARQWTEALDVLLKKQSSGLPLEDFSGTGNELLHLEEASKAFKNVRKILDI